MTTRGDEVMTDEERPVKARFGYVSLDLYACNYDIMSAISSEEIRMRISHFCTVLAYEYLLISAITNKPCDIQASLAHTMK